MPKKMNRYEMQNYVPEGNADGGQYTFDGGSSNGGGSNSNGGSGKAVKNDNKAKKISKQEEEAAEYYTSGDGMWINQYLRNPKDYGNLSKEEEEFIKGLDKLTNNKIEDKKLYRSVDANVIFDNLSSTDFDNMNTFLRYGEDFFDKGNYSQNILKKAKDNINKIKDTIKEEKGYMSTTRNKNVAGNWGGFTGSEMPIVMEITTNNNTTGFDVSFIDEKHTNDNPQEETLLSRNQKYKINDVYYDNDIGSLVVKCQLVDKSHNTTEDQLKKYFNV